MSENSSRRGRWEEEQLSSQLSSVVMTAHPPLEQRMHREGRLKLKQGNAAILLLSIVGALAGLPVAARGRRKCGGARISRWLALV